MYARSCSYFVTAADLFFVCLTQIGGHTFSRRIFFPVRCAATVLHCSIERFMCDKTQRLTACNSVRVYACVIYIFSYSANNLVLQMSQRNGKPERVVYVVAYRRVSPVERKKRKYLFLINNCCAITCVCLRVYVCTTYAQWLNVYWQCACK